MLDKNIRTLILRLRYEAMCDKRAIARMLGVGRNTVTRVLREGDVDIDRAEAQPRRKRTSFFARYVDRIRELYGQCGGNLAQVRRELEVEGVTIAYSTLQDLCRRHAIRGIPLPPRKRRLRTQSPEQRRKVVQILRELLAECEGD